ncbi:MAG: hypothetical protein ACUVUR_06255 [bacterium]
MSPSAEWLEIVFPLQKGKKEARISLLELLHQAPEFLGMALSSEGLPRAVAVLPNSSSGRVLIGVDELGKITLIGCPDQSVESGIGSMVGDLLAASGRLWHQPFSALTEIFGNKDGIDLIGQIRSRVGDFAIEQLKRNVEKSLEEGRFPIVIVVERVDETVEQMMNYLKEMNLAVRMLSYQYFQIEGVEIVLPIVLGEKIERLEEPLIRPARTSFLKHPPTIDTVSTEESKPARTYEPFPVEGTTPKQQEILERLVYIEDLGLIRRGYEFFSPRAAQRPEAEGTIVVAVDQTRWPFPKDDEIKVVVRTAREHLSGFLGMKQQEVEDFLRLLPRDEKKEHKGVLLFWARNVYEANQLVNELKALKEVSSAGVK